MHIHYSPELKRIINRVPYALRVKFADLCGLRAALIPSNYDYLFGVVAYAECIPGEYGITGSTAATLRAWLSVTQLWAKGKTYDTLTAADKALIAEAKKFFKGD